jgi:hypothetical protein
MPSVLSKRCTSLGKGLKYDFTKENKGKCDKFYNSFSDFDPKHPHSPRFTFGISRSHYEKVYIESNKSIDKNVPGPGKYDTTKPFGKDAFKFSIRGKGKLGVEGSKMPGPGQYNQISLSSTGKYPLSSYNNLRSIKFGKQDEQRFIYTCNCD